MRVINPERLSRDWLETRQTGQTPQHARDAGRPFPFGIGTKPDTAPTGASLQQPISAGRCRCLAASGAQAALTCRCSPKAASWPATRCSASTTHIRRHLTSLTFHYSTPSFRSRRSLRPLFSFPQPPICLHHRLPDIDRLTSNPLLGSPRSGR